MWDLVTGIESFATTGHSSEDCGKGGPTALGASTSWWPLVTPMGAGWGTEVPESLTFEARAGGLVELSLEHGSNTTGVMLETEAVWNCLLFHCEILGVLGMLILSTWNMKSHKDMRRTTGFLVKNNPKALCHTCYWRFWHDSCCPANLREMRSFPSFVQLSCLLQSRILSFLGTPETLQW